MPHLTVRLEYDVSALLERRADRDGVVKSRVVRDALDAWLNGPTLEARALDQRLNEILMTGIETYAVLATSVGTRTPELLVSAREEARQIIESRGLRPQRATEA